MPLYTIDQTITSHVYIVQSALIKYCNTNIIIARVIKYLIFYSCETDHCVAVSKVRDKLSENKQTIQKFHIQR
jgi:hypothetical protein